MRVMKFISRHVPTPTQLALEKGYQLVHVGDADAFKVGHLGDPTVNDIMSDGCRAVAVVHPSLALVFAANGCWVGVFENANRAPEGEKPQFEAVALHMYGPVVGR